MNLLAKALIANSILQSSNLRGIIKKEEQDISKILITLLFNKSVKYIDL